MIKRRKNKTRRIMRKSGKKMKRNRRSEKTCRIWKRRNMWIGIRGGRRGWRRGGTEKSTRTRKRNYKEEKQKEEE